MAATKRNAGLTSAIPRPTLNDEDLVRIIIGEVFSLLGKISRSAFSENTCVQEIPSSSDLSDFVDDPSQFYALQRNIANLLLRVRR